MIPARSDALSLGTLKKSISCEQSKGGLDESSPYKTKKENLINQTSADNQKVGLMNQAPTYESSPYKTKRRI